MPQALSREQARAVDRVAIEELQVPGLVLMENAGRGCVDLLQQLGCQGPVVVCCGKGNNGGDGLVIARHLAVRHIRCSAWLCLGEAGITGDALANLQMARRLGLAIHTGPPSEAEQELSEAPWIVDAMLGSGALGDPREPLAAWIRAVNQAPGEVLAVDLPSGLDCDSGKAGEPTIIAQHTATMAAPKLGLLAPQAAPFVGQVHVVELGVPWTALEQRL